MLVTAGDIEPHVLSDHITNEFEILGKIVEVFLLLLDCQHTHISLLFLMHFAHVIKRAADVAEVIVIWKGAVSIEIYILFFQIFCLNHFCRFNVFVGVKFF